MESSGVEPGTAIRVVPAPFNQQILQNALEELTDGARLAVQTCLDLWRDHVRTVILILSFPRSLSLKTCVRQKFGTNEFISFIKCYSFQSGTIAAVFASINDSIECSDALSCKSTGDQMLS